MKEYIVHVPKHLETNQEEIVSFFGEPIIELTRCKDCKHYRKEYYSNEYYCNFHFEGIDGEPLIPTTNDYCSWADPKDSTAEVRRQLKEQEQRKEMERKK